MHIGLKCRSLGIFVMMGLAGCGGSDNAETKLILCEPGEVQECLCSGDLPKGVQSCRDDGGGWEECRCDHNDTDTVTDIITDEDVDSVTDTSGDGDTDTRIDGDTVSAIETDSESGTDSGTDSDITTDTETNSGWTIEVVDSDNAGEQAASAIRSNDSIAAAYFSTASYEDGLCDEIDAAFPPTRIRYDLRYASKAKGSAWQVETVDSPLYPELEGPTGLSVAFNADDEPSIAYNGGEVDARYDYCGASNAVLTTKSGGVWRVDTACADSGESITDKEESQAGFGVGWRPALAYDAEGEPAIVHRDVHFVYLQSDDTRRADAEFAWRRGASWLHEAIDPGDGAGAANAVIFDTTGRPIVFYSIPDNSATVSRRGVWAARRAEDGTWEKIQLHSGGIGDRISAAMDPNSEEPVVAFYSASDYGVKICRLVDGEDFSNADLWTCQIVGDSGYDDGKYASLAFSPTGDPALAYLRCRKNGSVGSSCDPNDEAVIFSINRQGIWESEIVKTSDEVDCGMYTTLGFTSDGTANITFQCVLQRDSEFGFALLMASKKFI